jgi:uncharacterized protein
MFETNAHVHIATPQRYALRLAKHFEHRVSVHREDSLIRIYFPDATCELRPQDEHLDIQVLSESLSVLARCREVVARHLKQVAASEEFAIDWSGLGEEAHADIEAVAEGYGR